MTVESEAATEVALGSELAVLFGDELAEVSSARIGVRVVGGAKVSAKDLSATLLALGVAELHHQGLARLSDIEVKKLFRTKRTLSLQTDAGGAGLTAAIASAARSGMPIDDLALTLLGGRVSTPEMALIAAAKAHLLSTGAVIRVEEKGVRRLGGKLGMSPFEIDEAAAERLRGEWQALRRSWEAWRDRDRELASRLMDACASSISAATEVSD